MKKQLNLMSWEIIKWSNVQLEFRGRGMMNRKIRILRTKNEKFRNLKNNPQIQETHTANRINTKENTPMHPTI
jgi:hypothetical protein